MWTYAVMATDVLMGKLGKSPLEALTCFKPNLRGTQVIGKTSHAYVQNPQ